MKSRGALPISLSLWEKTGGRETVTASTPYILRNGAGAMTFPEISSPVATGFRSLTARGECLKPEPLSIPRTHLNEI